MLYQLTKHGIFSGTLLTVLLKKLVGLATYLILVSHLEKSHLNGYEYDPLKYYCS